MAKLIRDKVPQLPWHDETAKQFVRPVNDPQEGHQLIRQKILEEVGELIGAYFSSNVLQESADVLEVLITICRVHGYSIDDLWEAREIKHQLKGGFGDDGPLMVWDLG